MQESDRDDSVSIELAVTTGDVASWTGSATPQRSASPASAPAPTQAAPTAGRYRPLQLLGKGGMGEVMLCSDGIIRREVAMKRILPGHSDDADARTRFVREGQIQGQLEHPAIVPVYDMGIAADGPVFFTMKRLRGRTLDDILRGLRKSEPEELAAFPRYRLLQTLSSICLAIDFAHSRGVIHRDLKPLCRLSEIRAAQ